jgi:hypothetical protein
MTDELGKPWRWPGEWVRQESFWRDVTTRTMSVLVSGAILYLLALAGGYVSRPGTPLIVAMTVFGLIGGAFSFRYSLGRAARALATPRHGAPVSVRAIRVMLVLSSLALISLLALLAWLYIELDGRLVH